jgi:hypothetical protein
MATVQASRFDCEDEVQSGTVSYCHPARRAPPRLPGGRSSDRPVADRHRSTRSAKEGRRSCTDSGHHGRLRRK